MKLNIYYFGFCFIPNAFPCNIPKGSPPPHTSAPQTNKYKSSTQNQSPDHNQSGTTCSL